MTLTSIIIPVTRMSGKLQELKLDIRNALNLGFEIVLVHDKADEETSLELKQLAQELKGFNNFKFYEEVFGNPGGARNAGLAICSGNYIGFWDADDHPNLNEFLDYSIAVARAKADIGVAEFSTKNISGITQFYNFRFKSWTLNQIIIGLNPGLWRFLFSKDLAKNLLFPLTKMGEDQIFIAKATLIAKSHLVYRRTVYSYRTDVDGQLTRSKNAIKDLRETLNELRTLLMSYPVRHSNFLSVIMLVKLTLTMRKVGVVDVAAETFRTLRLLLIISIRRKGRLLPDTRGVL